jgi:hypothetical protein
MYIVIRKYDLIPGTAEEFIQHMQKSLVPIIKRVPGLREFSVVEIADNELVAISVFESLADAKVSALSATGQSRGIAPRCFLTERIPLPRQLYLFVLRATAVCVC